MRIFKNLKKNSKERVIALALAIIILINMTTGCVKRKKQSIDYSNLGTSYSSHSNLDIMIPSSNYEYINIFEQCEVVSNMIAVSETINQYNAYKDENTKNEINKVLETLIANNSFNYPELCDIMKKFCYGDCDDITLLEELINTWLLKNGYTICADYCKLLISYLINGNTYDDAIDFFVVDAKNDRIIENTDLFDYSQDIELKIKTKDGKEYKIIGNDIVKAYITMEWNKEVSTTINKVGYKKSRNDYLLKSLDICSSLLFSKYTLDENMVISVENDIEYQKLLMEWFKIINSKYFECQWSRCSKDEDLSKISEKFHVEIEDLNVLNPSWKNMGKGSIIKIPDNATLYVSYIVQEECSINDICERIGMSKDLFMKLNNIESDSENLQIGKTYTIAINELSKYKLLSSDTNYYCYIIQNGDTLIRISQKYNIDNYDELITLNSNIIPNPDIIEEGTMILIPKQNKEYIVGIDISRNQGDINFEKIANSNNVDYVFTRMNYIDGEEFGFDANIEKNYSSLVKNNLETHFYIWLHLKDERLVEKEIDMIIEKIKMLQEEFGVVNNPAVFIDFERADSFNNFDDDKVIETCGTNAIEAIKKIEENNIHAGIYINGNILEKLLKSIPEIADYDLWVAKYWYSDERTIAANLQPTDKELENLGNYPWSIFQASQMGKIDGIDGNVDIDFMTRDYHEELIKENSNKSLSH